jgi:hypothetical protein
LMAGAEIRNDCSPVGRTGRPEADDLLPSRKVVSFPGTHALVITNAV